MNFDLAKVIDTGGTVVIALALLKLVVNDFAHIHDALVEVKTLLKKISDKLNK